MIPLDEIDAGLLAFGQKDVVLTIEKGDSGDVTVVGGAEAHDDGFLVTGGAYVFEGGVYGFGTGEGVTDLVNEQNGDERERLLTRF